MMVLSCDTQAYECTNLTSEAYQRRVSEKSEGTNKENIDGGSTKTMNAKGLNEDILVNKNEERKIM